MDPQQELFSAVLMALKEKYEGTGVGVYDTVLPPKDTPYPFIYLADCSESDQATKNEIIGEANLTLKVWHDNIRQRGTVSGILADIKKICGLSNIQRTMPGICRDQHKELRRIIQRNSRFLWEFWKWDINLVRR